MFFFCFVFPAPFIEEAVFSPLYILLCHRLSNCRCMGLSLGCLSCTLDLYFVFCANHTVFFFFLIQQVLIIYFMHISVYMSIPISQFIPPPPPCPLLSPLGVHTIVLYICVSIFALQTGSSVPFFCIPHICVNI